MILELLVATALQAAEADAYLRSGQEKLKVRTYDAAIPEFESCLKLDPEQWNAHYGLGICYWEKEDYARARGHFQKLVELVEKRKPDATLTDVHQKLLGCHLLLEDYDRALEEAARLIKIQPTAEYSYDRALARQRKGEPEAALEEAAAALKETPGLTKARTLRAAVLLSKGDAEGALKELTDTIAEKPGDRGGYLGRGCAHYFLGNWAEAGRDLKEAMLRNKGLNFDPEEQAYATALFWLALARGGDPREAKTWVGDFRKLLKDLGKDPSRNHLYSLPFYLAGEVSEADLLKVAEGATFRKAQTLCEVHCFIGERKLLEGDQAGAKQAFQKAVASGARGLLESDLAIRRLKELGP